MLYTCVHKYTSSLMQPRLSFVPMKYSNTAIETSLFYSHATRQQVIGHKVYMQILVLRGRPLHSRGLVAEVDPK